MYISDTVVLNKGLGVLLVKGLALMRSEKLKEAASVYNMLLDDSKHLPKIQAIAYTSLSTIELLFANKCNVDLIQHQNYIKRALLFSHEAYKLNESNCQNLINLAIIFKDNDSKLALNYCNKIMQMCDQDHRFQIYKVINMLKFNHVSLTDKYMVFKIDNVTTLEELHHDLIAN